MSSLVGWKYETLDYPHHSSSAERKSRKLFWLRPNRRFTVQKVSEMVPSSWINFVLKIFGPPLHGAQRGQRGPNLLKPEPPSKRSPVEWPKTANPNWEGRIHFASGKSSIKKRILRSKLIFFSKIGSESPPKLGTFLGTSGSNYSCCGCKNVDGKCLFIFPGDFDNKLPQIAITGRLKGYI